MNISKLLLLLIVTITSAYCSTGGNVELVCPVDGTKFSAWQNFSGTSFGARLDLKKIGPIAQPWALAQCPKCLLPLHQEKLSPDEVKVLEKIVTAPSFKEAAKGKPPYFALALIKEAQAEAPFEIAWAYLQASWQVENRDKALYHSILKNVIAWCNKVPKNTEKAEDRELALYLPVELYRRMGEFELAGRALKEAQKITTTEIEWLKVILNFQQELIARKDASSYTFDKSKTDE